MEKWKRDRKKERKLNENNWLQVERKKLKRMDKRLEEKGRICCGKADPS
jgi:hypothetical protein